MATIVIRKRLTRKDIDAVIPQIEEWFKANPRKRVCYTDYWRVRRKHILEDILEQEKPIQ